MFSRELAAGKTKIGKEIKYGVGRKWPDDFTVPPVTVIDPCTASRQNSAQKEIGQ